MRAMLKRRFGADPDVTPRRPWRSVDLEDKQMSFDHMHLTVAGTQKIAAALVEPVIEMAAQRKAKTS